MPRFFTLAQAENLLHEVEPEVQDAILQKTCFQEAEAELQNTHRRIMMLGGVQVDREWLGGLKSRRESCGSKLKEAVEKIHSRGCLIKDLDTGLVDFPTLFKGQEVYLCWKLGETGIEFWHGVEEGFRGRKKIDREFLDNHKGDLTN